MRTMVIESAGHRGVRGVRAIILMQRRHNLSILGKGFTVITFDASLDTVETDGGRDR